MPYKVRPVMRVHPCPARCNGGWVLDRKRRIQVRCTACGGKGYIKKRG